MTEDSHVKDRKDLVNGQNNPESRTVGEGLQWTSWFLSFMYLLIKLKVQERAEL